MVTRYPDSKSSLACLETRRIDTLPLFVLGLLGSMAMASDDTAFFTERIQPILENRCYECHSHTSGKMKAGLTLDSRSGWSEGGDSGPAVVPGRPAESLLIKAVQRVEDDTAMPPKKPLPENEVSLLVEWVKRGAPDPRTSATTAVKDKGPWWSLQPLPANAPTGVSIDTFIQAKLVEKSLRLAPEADRRTLIRRVTFDLHGLAPTRQEVAAFVSDPDPQAYEKLVDRLLASPRYGERWARHWLDTVHFADTHGFEHDRIRDHAWRYRDYVIAALNTDTPWPRFIREQLAADAFFPGEPRLTAALGFLGAGPFDQSAADTAPKMFEIVDRDDMVTQTMAAFTSTTANCARCHDHKFDPIPQRDYYALAAVFAGVTKGDVSYDEMPSTRETRAHWQKLDAATKAGDAAVLLGSEGHRISAEWEKALNSFARWETPQPISFTSAGGSTLQPRDDASLLSSGARPDVETLSVTLTPKLRALTVVRLEVLADDTLPKRGPGRQDNGNLHLSEFELFAEQPGKAPRRVAIRQAIADFNQEGWTIAHAIDGNEKTAWGIYPRVGESHIAVFELSEKLTLAEGASLRCVLKQLHGTGHIIGRLRLSVTDAPPSLAAPLPATVAEALALPSPQRSQAQELALAAQAIAARAQEELAKLPPPEFVYAAGTTVLRGDKRVSLSEPKPISVLKRGDLNQPGELSTPGALACVTELKARFDFPDPKSEAARRAALADWLADPRNPLTWRSIVNRVWHYHFDKGLVDTPNDLGRMGGMPSHPELLDWLAADFRDHGGSLKRLHRMIVTSAAYRQGSSQANSDPAAARGRQAFEIDADNRLLWHAPRRRLDAESFRDVVLQVAGQLDLTMGGPSVKYFKVGPMIQDTPMLDYTGFDWDQPGVNRRSIYRLVYRNIADPFMAALDFPDAAQLAPTRPFSASALQALALWNNNFVLRESEHFASRLEKLAPDLPGRVHAAVRESLLREPREEEAKAFIAYAERHGLPALCRVLFNSNEFLFVE